LPAERGVAVAEARGRIVEIFAEEGDTVQPGQALARLDSAEAASRLEIAQQRLRRSEAEARRWQQDEDMARLRAAKIDQDRAREEVAKLEEDIRRATLSAPVGGVVLTKDLALRRGEVVEAGTVVCEVASLARWDLQIEVNEADVGRLEQALVRRGTLPVRYALQARSDLALEASVAARREVGQMAYPTERGEQVVYVTLRGIALPPELAADMRPGFTGLAKIQGAKEPFVVVAFSRLVRFIRLRVLL
jgi:multidrug efflux pump subunit AcrA (membrane-fusion protein)